MFPCLFLTLVSCVFFLDHSAWLVTQLCPTLGDPMNCSPQGSPVHGASQARKNTGVGCYSLLQGIFLTQGLNPHLLNWQADSLSLSTWEAQFIGATA